MGAPLPSTVTPTTVSTTTASPSRWRTCALLFVLVLVCNADRQVLGLLAPLLCDTFAWDQRDYGHLVTAFTCAYACALIPVGRLVDRVGTRFALAGTMVLWACAGVVNACAGGFAAFLAGRLTLGAAEAGVFPTAVKVVTERFPARERALASGIFNSGAMIAAVAAPWVVLPATTWLGWRSLYVALAALALLWAAAWWFLPRPAATPRLAALPWRTVLRCRGTWTFVAGKLLADPVWFFLLFWLPDFLHRRHGLEPADAALPVATVYGIAAVGSIAGGWATALLAPFDGGTGRARHLVLLGCAVLALPVTTADAASSPWLAVLVVAAAAAAHAGWTANLYALAAGSVPAGAIGAVTAIGTMAGAVGAMVMAQCVGRLLHAGLGHGPIFLVAGCAYLIAWIIIILIDGWPQAGTAR